MKRNLPFGKINEKRKYFRRLKKGGEVKMKLEEKIKEVLEKHFPAGKKPCTDSWRWGFRTGFREGYKLAYKEIEETLKFIRKE